MDESDRKHFGETLRAMCGIHRIKFDKALVDGYWGALRTMSRAQFDAAVESLNKTEEWMPKPTRFWQHSRRGWQ
jgi:hypothetical protein